MEQVDVGKIKTTKLSKEDMAKYIEEIYNHPVVKQVVHSSKSYNVARTKNDLIGDFCLQYVKSTGDLNPEKIGIIAEGIRYHYEEYIAAYRNPMAKSTPKAALFYQTTSPLVIEYWSEKMGKTSPLDLQDSVDILSAVKTNCGVNKFTSHSFSGALLSEVEQNGLDIEKELFKDEYKTLSKLGTSAFMTGKLFVCELSYASIGYTHSSPERLRMVLKSAGVHSRQDTETDKEYLTRCLNTKINETKLSESDRAECLAAGSKMIDFYESDSDSAIAIMEQESRYEYQDMSNILVSSISSIGLDLAFKIKKQIPSEMLSELKEIGRDRNNPQALSKLKIVIDKIKGISPEVAQAINGATMSKFNQVFTQYSVSNFEYANADGYEVSDGKISRDKMAIAHFENLAKSYSSERIKGQNTGEKL